jgi:excisionase family DNA binding protein
MSKPQLDDEVMTMEEVAILLRVETKKVYEITRKRFKRRRGFVLPKFRVGRELRFRRKDVEAWIDRATKGENEG